ncbi:hypothetical protein QVD17_08706 [Tagetes erecta]|uniref:Uncharacterized protein n=1 Tax=Tagetes erecta TaxID=13708 RepID=A0AAD8P4Q5_TARER|nr:hypothetical protein QVD17_08706 [Tagetes erecta]
MDVNMGKRVMDRVMDHSDQTKRPFSSSLHRIFTFTFIDLLLHRSTASSSHCFIISLLHNLFPPRTSIYCFIIFFHQEHVLVASSSPSPSSAVVGISDLVRCVAYGGCSHCMLLTYRKKRWIASIKPTGSMEKTGRRHPEMVEALYTMNRAYLSLPEGTASIVVLIAMVSDHYNAMLTACIRFVIRWLIHAFKGHHSLKHRYANFFIER